MCCKEEWAYAIRDIKKAIEHIITAQKKLEKIRDKSLKRYNKLGKKHGTPNELDEVREIIDRSNESMDKCLYIKYMINI